MLLNLSQLTEAITDMLMIENDQTEEKKNKEEIDHQLTGGKSITQSLLDLKEEEDHEAKKYKVR